MDKRVYPAVFHTEEVGGYSVTFPDLPGCITEGDTIEEALREIEYVVLESVTWMREEGETVQPYCIFPQSCGP